MKKIDRREGLTPEEFKEEYLIPSKPVILTDYASSWAATSRWTPEFFKEHYGHIEVPVFSRDFSKPGKKYMAADQKMKFGDYLDLILEKPTDLRLFLFNIFKHAPELRKDFDRPTIMNGFLMRFPLMFFGGAGSSVQLHYDIDLAHVFHTQFYGQKRVVLFPPEESTRLYRHPFTVRTPVDIDNPDLERYPRFQDTERYEDMIHPGETVFMPTGYWHFMNYVTGGYSMSLRANDSLIRKVKGVSNILFMVTFDKSMNRMLGKRWYDIKENMAIKRAG